MVYFMFGAQFDTENRMCQIQVFAYFNLWFSQNDQNFAFSPNSKFKTLCEEIKVHNIQRSILGTE